MKDTACNLLAFYYRKYENLGSGFVKAFIKFGSIQNSCEWCIKESGLKPDENEKVKKYVEGLGIAKADVLEKLLNIFLMIKTDK